MFSPADTIVAVATSRGQAGLGVVRISGPDAGTIAQRLLHLTQALSARHATLARVRASATPGAQTIDQVIAIYFSGPRSYTGEDVVEISGHGSPVVMQLIVDAALAAGARRAEPGEFTLRAFLNGRIDLVQAEAVKDLIDAVTPLQARAAFDQLEGTLTERVSGIDHGLFDLVARLEASLDFPDEGFHFVRRDEVSTEIDQLLGDVRALINDGGRGRLLREGCQVVIVGRPNVGKSMLFNALVGAERAIVTRRPGTTRDMVTERVDIGGVPVTLVDTAGVRKTVDEVESEGVRRTYGAIEVADLLIVVLDRSQDLTTQDHNLLASTAIKPRVVAGHKVDLPHSWGDREAGVEVCGTSAVNGLGLDELRKQMLEQLGADRVARDPVMVTNDRHVGLLKDAQSSLVRAAEAARCGQSEEFVLSDLEGARAAVESIIGARTSEDVLRHIFSSFCVGK